MFQLHVEINRSFLFLILFDKLHLRFIVLLYKIYVNVKGGPVNSFEQQINYFPRLNISVMRVYIVQSNWIISSNKTNTKFNQKENDEWFHLYFYLFISK